MRNAECGMRNHSHSAASLRIPHSLLRIRFPGSVEGRRLVRRAQEGLPGQGRRHRAGILNQ